VAEQVKSGTKEYKLKWYHEHKGITRPYIKLNLKISRCDSDYMKVYYEQYKKKFPERFNLRKKNGWHSWNYDGGKPKCQDCGKELSTYTAKRCQKCAYKGELNPCWRGGKRYKSKIRCSDTYKLWRLKILEGDEYTCCYCFQRGGKLEVHHYPATFVELLNKYKITSTQEALKCKKLWSLKLGITLCLSCHKNSHKKKKGNL